MSWANLRPVPACPPHRSGAGYVLPDGPNITLSTKIKCSIKNNAQKEVLHQEMYTPWFPDDALIGSYFCKA